MKEKIEYYHCETLSELLDQDNKHQWLMTS